MLAGCERSIQRLIGKDYSWESRSGENKEKTASAIGKIGKFLCKLISFNTQRFCEEWSKRVLGHCMLSYHEQLMDK